MFSKKIALVAALLVASFTAQAEVGDVSIGLGAGITQGTGFEIGYEISDTLSMRAVSYSGELNKTESLDGISYAVKLKTQTPGLMFDFYPSDGRSFRVTAGAVSNGNSLSATANSSANYDIGGVNYTQSEVGSLTSEIAFSGISPYVGLGYQMHATKQLSIDFDAGMLISSSPVVTMTTDGTLVNDVAFKAELEKERKSLENDLSSFEYLPMAKISITYKF